MSATIEAMAPLGAAATTTPWGWYALASDDDLSPGAAQLGAVADTSVLLYRGESGEPHALAPYCARRGCPLAAGTVVGDTLRCPFDGWLWNSDGTCDGTSATIASYPTIGAAGLLMVRFGTAARATPSRHRRPLGRREAVRNVHPYAAAMLLTDPVTVAHLLDVPRDRASGQDPDLATEGELRVRLEADGLAVTTRAYGPGLVQVEVDGLGSITVAVTPRRDGTATVRTAHTATGQEPEPTVERAVDRVFTLLDGMAAPPDTADTGSQRQRTWSWLHTGQGVRP